MKRRGLKLAKSYGLGAIFRAKLDEDDDFLPGQGAVELGIDTQLAPGILTYTQTVPVLLRAKDVEAGGHTLAVYWQATDAAARCLAHVAPDEASILIQGVSAA